MCGFTYSKNDVNSNRPDNFDHNYYPYDIFVEIILHLGGNSPYTNSYQLVGISLALYIQCNHFYLGPLSFRINQI